MRTWCVLGVLTGVLAAQAADVAAALERARPALWKHLERGEGGRLGLLVLAAAQEGLPQGDARFVNALGKLDATNFEDTYGIALRLIAFAELEKPHKLKRRIQDDAKRLLAFQNTIGGFSYGKAAGIVWDLSNTQFAALGLRAAAALGVEVPQECWSRLATLLIRFQRADGGFAYVDFPSSKPYSSMTVAGIGVLEICRQHLDPENEPPGLDQALAKAWEWMASHEKDVGSQDAGNCFYFHYGLERACVLSGVETVGGVDWYRKGAAMLLAMQKHGGGWFSRMDVNGGELNPAAGIGSPIDTAFAVLFLRKRFQKVLVTPLTPKRPLPIGRLGAQASAGEIQESANAAIARGKAALPRLLVELRSEFATRRRAAALALTKLSGREFGYDPGKPPAEQRAVLDAIEAWMKGG